MNNDKTNAAARTSRFSGLSGGENKPLCPQLFHKPPVLILEDEDVRHDYVAALKDIAAVDAVADVESALQLIQEKQYVAALLDVRVGPDLQGGFRVADAFAKESPETELVFNSAYYGEEDPMLFFERFSTFLVFERKVERGPELRHALLGAISAYKKAEQTRALLEQIQLLGNSVEDLLSGLVARELTAMEAEDASVLPEFDALFRMYQRAGFLYPEKLNALLPHYETVRTTWECLALANDDLGKTIVRSKNGDPTSAVSAFAYAPGTWLAQHLASVERGEYIGTLSVLVGLFQFFHENRSTEFCRLTHIANHPAVSPLFAGLAASLPRALSHYQTYDWIIAPLSQIQTEDRDSFVTVSAMTMGNTATQTFLREHLGAVVYEALRFASDPELAAFGTQVSRYGLTRGRRIFTAEDAGKLIGVVICNTGSLGMNFSFHENTLELVIDPCLGDTEQERVFACLVAVAADYYQSQGQDFLVGLFDPAHRVFRQEMGLTMTRERQFSVLTWGRGEEETFQTTCDYYTRFYKDLFLRRTQRA